MSHSQMLDDLTPVTVEEEINYLKDKLCNAEKLSAFCQMMSGITHELNTPLGVCITANSSLIQNSNFISTSLKGETLTSDQLVSYLDDVKEITQVVENNLKRTLELVNSIKQVSSEQQINKFEIFNLAKSLSNIYQSLSPQLRVQNIVLEIECDRDLLIEYKQGDIYSIVCNLIQNAVKHAYDNNQSGKILIQCTYNDESAGLDLNCQDFGRGMTEEERSKIFMPYFTTTKDKDGTGLGLAIIKEIVERDGGQVKCTSEVGKGSNFTFLVKCQRQ